MTNLEKISKSDIAYSEQSKNLIANLKDNNFNVEKFEVWFKDQIIVGGSHVLQFLQQNPTQSEPDTKAEALDESPNLS